MKNFLSKRLKRKICKSDIISFDIFDTLIKRLCKNSYDIFEMVEINYNNKHPQNKIKNFKENRILAESKARKKNNLEVTLDDIYMELPDVFNKDELIKLEIEAETEICTLNEEIVPIYKYCKKMNKIIIIVSDMYLDKNIIANILKKCKIAYNELFVSSDIKLTKTNGSIYNYILKKYNIPGNKLLHIGNSFKSDYVMSKLKEIKAFLYKSNSGRSNEKNYKLYFLNQIINSKLKNTQDEYYKFGYKNLGPLMFGFCNYIYENIKSNDNIFFLSREGKFIKECFDIMFPNFNTFYLYVSRKSITSSLITKFNSFEDLINNQSITKCENLEMFLKRTGLYSEKNVEYISSKNINMDKSPLYEKNRLFLEENFNILKSNIVEKQSCFEKYLKQVNFNNNSILIDIGWAGTMQDILQKKLGFENIKGYYLGVRKKKYNKNKNGYLYNNNEKSEIKYRSMNGLLELLFAANHGSTVGYSIDDKTKKIKPIFLDNELSEKQFNNILKIQNGAKDFIMYYKDLKFKLDLGVDEYSYNLFKLGLLPKMDDVNLFKDFYMYDEKITFLIENKSLKDYLFHPKQIINDYIESGWKNAFLKNVFKIKIPYWHLYYLLSKINKKR